MADDPSQHRPWEPVSSEVTADYHIFRARIDTLRSPKTGQPHRFVVLQSPEWVNVVPVTADGRVVLVRQLRHGICSLSLEIPGGLVDPGETPAQAASRELLEETGYHSARWEALGFVHPNPAIQDNGLHTFLALDCERVAEPALEGTEDISVELVPVAQLPELVASGQITHALVIVALYWFLYERARR